MEDGGSETKMCNNCKRDISAANFVMHEMHCRRHIVLCEHCKEPVPRSEIDQHFNDLHVTLPCEKCKQNIAKDKMEKHKSSECEKRPVPCEFCELTFPKNEFESHADFCGSRTECCPLCQQYVMLKDMLQHENSGCTYPPPKPAAVTQPASHVADLDPFSMLEMHQLLNGDNFGATGLFSDFSSNLRTKHERNGQYRPSLDHSERAKSNISSRVGARVAKKEPARKKTDVNIQRANNLSSQTRGHKDFDIPPDMDYDTMLALQLAHDDWLQFDEEHTENIVPDDLTPDSFQFVDHLWDIEPAQAEQNTREKRVSEEGNHTTIPCEFCEEEVPLETYIDHTENCPLSNTRSNNSTRQDLNNEMVTLPWATERPSIPVINNLGTPASMQRYQDLSSDIEEFMLPCEFCEEMFPSEIIIQHQSVCQANGMITPRVMTPASGLRTVSNKPPTVSTTSFKRHSMIQQPQHSLLDFDGELVEDYFSANSEPQRVPQSISNKYSSPVDRFDDAVARPPCRSSKPCIADNNSDQQGNGSGWTGPARQGRRENSSAQRARARLNQLLQEDEDNNIGASGNTASNGTRRVHSDRKSNVDSRSVMRQLDASKMKSSKNRGASNTVGNQDSRRLHLDNNISRNNSSNGSSGGASQVASGGARSRQRADHVFSPELRLKPDHNPRPKKQ